MWYYFFSHLGFILILMFYYHPFAGQISGKKVAPIYHKEQYNCEA